MNTYKTCPDCKRQIPESIFDRATAHGVGCATRRSLLAKDAYAEKQKRLERARKAAQTRAARRAGI